MQFTTKNSSQIDLDISYANTLIAKAYDNKISWNVCRVYAVMENSY